MPLDKKTQFFQKAVELHNQKKNQKEIASQIGVTEKTVSIWLKDIKKSESINKENLKNLENKLKLLSADKSSSTEDIKNITIAIEKLENRWFTKLNK